MGKHYYYEVDYRCDCEVCGKQIEGVIKRGPLEYNGSGVIPTGMGAALDAADMVLSRKLIQSAIDGPGNAFLLVSNADHCPHCGARQSWRPLAEPKKPGGIGGYIGAAFGGMLLGSLLGLVFVFLDNYILFLLTIILGGILGAFLVYRSRRKNGEKDQTAYQEAKREYDGFMQGLQTRQIRNKPEILWDTARRASCDF